MAVRSQRGGQIRSGGWPAVVLASAAAAVTLPQIAHAQTRTFTGTGDGTTYSNPANWSGANVPDTAAETAVIDTGGAFAVTLSTSGYTVGGLTIGSDDSLTQNNGVSYAIAGPISNAGSFVIASTSTYSDLYLGGASLSGGGTLTVANYTRLRGSGMFTNSSTIQGETNAGGSIGSDEVSITNAVGGLINANVAGNSLTLDPVNGTGTFINQGTLRASNTGTLILTGNGGGTFTNTGGLIQAQNASTVLLTNGASVTGGTFTTAGTGVIRAANATLSGITNTGNISLDNGTSLTLVGTIANSGTINVNSTSTYSDLFAGGATLTGSGTLTLNNYARVRGSGTFTNQGTINGAADNGGSLGADEISIANSGLIDANVSGRQLNVDPVNGGSVTNTGTLQASNTGTLVLTGNGGGTFTNTGGTIQALNASTVLLTANASVTGGTFTTAGTGVIRASNATLSGITNTGNISVDNNSNLSLVGTIANSGTINVNSTSTYSDLFAGGATLSSGGTVTLNNYARVRGSGTLTNNGTINGAADNGGSLGSDEISVANGGLIDANVAARQLVVDPTNGGSVTNTGTMQASNGGILVLTGNGGGAFTNTGGIIQALANSQVQLTATASVTGGTISSTGTGNVQLNSGQSASVIGPVTVAGTFNTANGSALNLSGAIALNGTLNVQSTGSFTDLNAGGATLSGTGTLNLQNADRVRGSGTFTIGSGNTVQGETSNSGSLGSSEIQIVNNGLVNANNAGGLALVVDPANVAGGFTNHGTLRASNGGVLVLTGANGGDFVNTAATIEALAGSQVQLTGAVAVTGGTISSTGTGNVQLNASQGATITGPVTVAGTFNALNGSALTLSGAFTNNGAINIQSTGGFTDLNAGGLTLSGTGTLNLQNADRVRGSGTFTNNQTIQGETSNSGSLGSSEIQIVNTGLVNANVNAAALVVDPANVSGGVTNTGTMQASNGGVLVLTGANGGDFLNTGGTIQALAGSQVQLTAGASVTGGTISSTGTGVVQLNGGQSAAVTGPVTVNGTFNTANNSTLNLSGAIALNGTLNVQSTGSFTDLNAGGATLSGTGTLNLQNADRVRGSGTFTIGSGNTVQGETSNSGSLGSSEIQIVNNGLVNANNASGAFLDIDPTNVTGGYTNSSTGTTRASGGGVLRLNGANGGSFTNNGTFEALNASTFTFVNGAVLTNSSGGTLTGGIYRSVATGGGSTLDIPGGNISVLAADATISGTGSVFSEINTITSTTTAGAFRVLNGRNFTTVSNYTNNGTTQLGGGTFTATGPLNNLTPGLFVGFGTVTNRIVNSGTVQATGGTLAVGGIDPATIAGTAQSDSGATLDLTASTSASAVNNLINNGSLALGAQNLLVKTDYTNANFGVGNAFNPRANVTGAGQVNASPAITQTVSGANVTNGTTATPTLNLGNIRVGNNVSTSFTVNNVGASGPSLRGAFQTNNTAGFGGNITDTRLSGGGVTPANFGPIAPGGNTGTAGVTFTGATAGALTGQKIAVVNNFDNVANQQITITGAAYNPAVASVTPNPVFVGNFHVLDSVPGTAITFANTAPAGAFSEDLAVSSVTATGTAALGTGSPTSFNVLAGGSNTAVKAAVSTATAGAKSGTITASLSSNATVNGVAISGLSPLSLTGASVSVTGNVYRLATASVTTPVALGDLHVGATATAVIPVNNTATNDGFSESLSAAAGAITGDVTAASGTATITPGGTSGNALTATLSTATAGAKSGTVAVGLTSIAGGTGLTNTALTGQSATVTGTVYNLAVPVINNPTIGFGIVHVGDSVTPVIVSIKNNAPATFSEKLNATTGTPGTGLLASGSALGIAPQATNAASPSVGISTASAAVINSLLPINFVSDGTGINSLGQTNLTSQNVTVTGQVNNYANAVLSKSGGSGTLTGGATSYTLNFGTVNQNSTSPQAQLSLLNGVLGPADTLAGGWTINAAQFTTSGFSSFSGIAAGGSIANLLVGLNTSTAGSFNGTITLVPRSQNSSGYDGALSNVILNLQGSVTAVPEPASLGVFAMLGGFALRRRRRS